MQIKYNYTSGGEYLLPDGNEYIGYFNVDEKGIVSTFRYKNDESIILENLESKFSSDYYRSEYYKDRYVFDVLDLPHKLEEITIQPNEIVSYSVLNKKIEFLHKNSIYLYKQMFMGSTDTPVDKNVNTLCNLIGTSEFGWYRRLENEIFGFAPLSTIPSLYEYREFDKMKRFVVIPFNQGNGIGIIGITDTHLIGLTSLITNNGTLSNAEFTLYTEVIDVNSDQKCLSLQDITYDGKYLYVTDSQINSGGQVFKYDITTYYSNDPIFEGKAFLVETIGGSGDFNKKNKFKGCTTLGSKNDEIWVYDYGNNCIKIYDSNFVWKRTISLPNTGKYTVMDIRHRKINNHMYVLYENSYDPKNLKYGLLQYDQTYKLVANNVFEDVLYDVSDGKFNRIAMSEQDSNVFYVITNNTVYKKFFSKPEQTFSIFIREDFYPDDIFIWDYIDKNWEDVNVNWNYSEFFNLDFTIFDIFILPSNDNYDNVYFMGRNYISALKERTDYISVLRNTDLTYYSFNRIKFSNMEYNQSLILNKEFYKLFANIVQLKNNLKGRFYAEYNNHGDIMYRDYIYLSDEEINKLNLELEYNTFINDNELVEPNVINRLLTRLYDLQMDLMDLTNTKLKNIKTWVDVKEGKNIYPID